MKLDADHLDIILKRARRIESDERRDVFFDVVAAELRRTSFITEKCVRRAIEAANARIKE